MYDFRLKKSAAQQKLLLPGPFYLGEEVNIENIPSSDEAHSVNPNSHFIFSYCHSLETEGWDVDTKMVSLSTKLSVCSLKEGFFG